MTKPQNIYSHYFLPLAQYIDPETIHNIILFLLSFIQKIPFATMVIENKFKIKDPRLTVFLSDIEFSNPVGLAAGFDKNAVAAKSLSAFGFSHVEVGTVTPLPQTGNPKPRLFRLTQNKALINRFGFSNLGIKKICQNLHQLKNRDFVLGVNIGPNFKSVQEGTFIKDYILCIQKSHKYCDYFTINISSPNTKGLRLLQEKKILNKILKTIFLFLKKKKIKKPIFVKIAPDLSENQIRELLTTVKHYPIAGIIATNTTIDRPKYLKGTYKTEAGGLSGQPLAKKSTDVIRIMYKHTDGKIPIIGVGGIFNAKDAIEKLKAGATLVQLYTGFIYEGPGIAKSINQGILSYMKKNKINSLKELIGSDSK